MAYDGVPDMAGLIVDELYKAFDDTANPHIFSAGVEELIDGLLEEIDFVADQQTSWWEVTDALFMAGYAHEASLAQRHAMPVLADIASLQGCLLLKICMVKLQYRLESLLFTHSHE